ncbi:MAG: B12-binding domain-containing radical SAM protein [Acidobacteria bacterium]|nr:B12-binding domain-containing radical SAM protein [Acidobacteriota bacterium]
MTAPGSRPLKVKFILPALTEATDPYWRPIKYSLFPPLGLATLAAYLAPDDDAVILDEHVEPLSLNDSAELVIIQVYITNAYRAYRIADEYRKRGAFVCLGGLHVTSLPEEAAAHADTIFLGPGEETFPKFLEDFRAGRAERIYVSSSGRTLERVPPVRRDLIRRFCYLVPNSIVVTRGCPQHCDFCYKDAFFQGGRGFYTQRVDDALSEIDRLPGRHLYFLDDHLLGDRHFAEALFRGMQGMGRLFQGAATVDSILRGSLIERAADAGLRSLFVGFETLAPENLKRSNKRQNLGRDYKAVTERLHSLGIMINGSFVFGMDDDSQDVFARTVDWAIEQGITTATFHIQTPYPGTGLHARMERESRMLTRDWNLYDTRHVVYRPARLTPEELKRGYDWAYREFYRWGSIARASSGHGTLKHRAKHFLYASGWKKFEPLWDLVIRARGLARVTPLLEALLSRGTGGETPSPNAAANPGGSGRDGAPPPAPSSTAGPRSAPGPTREWVQSNRCPEQGARARRPR